MRCQWRIAEIPQAELPVDLQIVVHACAHIRADRHHIRQLQVPEHTLDLCLGGRLEHRSDGRCWPVGPGQVIYHPPGATRDIDQRSAEPIEKRWIRFSGPYAEHLVARAGLREEPLRPQPADGRIEAALRQIVSLIEARAPGYAEEATLALIALLMHLGTAATRSVESHEAARLRSCLRADGEGLQQAAGRYGCSLAHFKRLFRQRIGITPWQYVLELRLERACTLLRDSELPIAAVAQAVGYADASQLARLFQARLGQSPRAYRSQAAALPSPGRG
jgi:AraC-like DNA-binding protein